MSGIQKFQTANELLDRVAVEVGLGQQPNPYTSQDTAIIQLRYFLDTAGQELLRMVQWEHLQEEHVITTSVPPDDGTYDLPDDFDHMIPQTHWDRSNRLPLYGPLSPQDWQYLIGRDLVSHTIYASFREEQGKFEIFPRPPPDGLIIAFEYMSRGWVESQVNPGTFFDHVDDGADTVRYDPPMVLAFVKLKFYEAKGFETTAAQGAFNRAFQSAAASDVSAPVLNAAGSSRRYPYLDPYRNLPDTNYGS